MTGVGHAIGERQLFADVNLRVSSGESVAVVGPSGAGKSTLLAIAGGLLRPTTGHVEFGDDRAYAGPSSTIAQQCAWVLQFAAVFPNRTVADNVSVPLVLAGVDAEERNERSSHALRFVELAEQSESRARHLSGGELQRLSIARAIAAQQPVVLADEPTSQLDARLSGLAVRSLLASCRGSILVIVTHDHEIARLCGRCYVLSDGGLTLSRPTPGLATPALSAADMVRRRPGVFDVRQRR